MKSQRMNPNNLNPMEMQSASAMMGNINSIQRIGSGKNRKFSIYLDKTSKKFLVKFLTETIKHFKANSPEVNPKKKKVKNPNEGVINFLTYFKEQCQGSSNEIPVSLDESKFIKQLIGESLTNMKSVKFKWYQLHKKLLTKMLLVQYQEVAKKLGGEQQKLLKDKAEGKKIGKKSKKVKDVSAKNDKKK